MTRGLKLALVGGCIAVALAAQGAPPPYAPGLGDFMTAYVQPHHLKLWYAGQAANWALAAYEADELGETFQDVSTYEAEWESVPVAQLIQTLIEPSLERVKATIEARNATQFRAAYTSLTSQCNACHVTAKKPFIEVEVPTRDSPFTDQVFAAP